jgi:hypothetical protein
VVALGDKGGFQEASLATDCPPAGAGGELCDAKNQFVANFQASQFVFGYVNTQFASRSYAPGSPLGNELVQWQQRFPTQIQGMFLDNGPTFDPSQSTLTDAQYRQYYVPLYTMLNGSQFQWQVQLNASQYPGQDANGGPSDWILSARAADSVVVFEQPINIYFNNYGAICHLTWGPRPACASMVVDGRAGLQNRARPFQCDAV